MEDSIFRRFWSKVLVGDGCWIWQAAKTSDGYGYFLLNGRMVNAHRVAYEILVGPIPEGLTLDHLCRNPPCVRAFDHLEPVTQATNTLRGIGPSAQNAVKTRCDHGHEFTPENTYWRGGQTESARARRQCWTCRRVRDAARIRDRRVTFA